MIRKFGFALLFSGLCMCATHVSAHFILMKPDPWVDEDQSPLGGGAPQKGGPCGPGGYDDVQPVPTNGKVTTVHAGDELSVEWKVTVGHSGFYRIALAKDRSELKDPDLHPDASCNFTTKIQDPPVYPVLVDNLDSNAVSQKIKIPADLTCEKCTLQVIMWMTDHPQGCMYYHCADLKVLPAGASAGAGGGTAGVGSGGSGVGGTIAMGSGGMGTGGTGAAGIPATGQGGAHGTGGTPSQIATGGTSGTPTGVVGPSAGTTGANPVSGGDIAGAGATPPATTKKSGCSVASGSSPASNLAFLLLVVPVLARRRRAS